jgi:hypothetical protein
VNNLEAETTAALAEAGVRRLMVFSHPNHEAAIFGMVRRLRPKLVILTDGGGEPRPGQSRQGLARIGMLERASFLGFREQDFYTALLDRDHGYFQDVIARVRAAIDADAPEQVWCDAVEFYNPVHDLSLPIVRAALGTRPQAAVFEVPLIHQKAGDPERYDIQRFPASRRRPSARVQLSAAEFADKLKVRDEVYDSLRQQLGPLLASLPADHFGTEIVGPAVEGLAEPAGDQTLRYDRRAKLLLERGLVQRAITHAEHYLPMAEAMLPSQEPGPA